MQDRSVRGGTLSRAIFDKITPLHSSDRWGASIQGWASVPPIKFHWGVFLSLIKSKQSEPLTRGMEEIFISNYIDY